MKLTEFLILFIIIASFAVLYNIYVVKETFNGTSTTATANTTTIPNLSKALFILTAYPDPNLQAATYSGATHTWSNAVVGTKNSFAVTGPVVPVSLIDSNKNVIGLPMNNVKLVGPPSESFSIVDAIGNPTYKLGSFTYSFYAAINSLPQPSADPTVTVKPIVLFKMFAENPNQFVFSISAKDATHVTFNVTLSKTLYSWDIETASVVGTGKHLFTVTFDSVSNALNMYKDTQAFTSPVSSYLPITLGPSHVHINSNSDWDATLFIFMFFSSAFSSTDIGALNEYVNRQSSGYYTDIANANAAAASTTTTYQQQLQDMANALAAAQNSCSNVTVIAPASAVVTPAEPKWQINMAGGGNIVPQDLTCGSLNIAPLSATTTSSSSVTKQSLPDKWVVPSGSTSVIGNGQSSTIGSFLFGKWI